MFKSIASQKVSVPDSDTTYHLRLCGTATKAPGDCSSDVGICRSQDKVTKTLVHANHKFVILSHAPHMFEVVYDSGTTCRGDQQWTAVVTLVCKWKGGSPAPVFVSDTDCTLRFVWRNSLFCDGREMCAAEDKATGYTYDLDALLSDTWSVRKCIYTMYMYIKFYTDMLHVHLYMHVHTCTVEDKKMFPFTVP